MKGLERHAGILLTSFDDKLQKLHHDADIDDIHNLRLDLKQLFALIKVLELCKVRMPDDFYESLKAVKILFKQTGIIRDNQLAVAYGHQILAFELQHALSVVAGKNIQYTRELIVAYLQSIDFEKVVLDLTLAFKETRHLKLDYILTHVNMRIQKDESKIIKRLGLEKGDYHMIRRCVKEQFYLLTVIKEVLGQNVKPRLILQKKKQAKLLGQWHDMVVLENHLNLWGLKIDDVEREKIRKMKNKYMAAAFD